MEQKVLISVIVPVYNSEKYLKASIESVLNQPFQEFELILVNDGSTDHSSEVCQSYAEKDNRIKYISKKNGGLCSARNAGIDVAVGEYIMFMDNDDELDKNALCVVWKAIQRHHADIIRFNRKRIQELEDGKTKEDIFGTKGICDDGKAHYMTRKTFFKHYTAVRNSGCFAGIWNGAFKRSLFENIRFDTEITAGGEDNLVNILLYSVFTSAEFIPDVLYTYYRRVSHSVSTKFEKNHFLANMKCARAEKLLIEKEGLPLEEYYHPALIYMATSVKIMIHKNSTMSRKEIKAVLADFRKQDCYKLDSSLILKSSATLSDKMWLYLFEKGYDDMLLQVSKIVFHSRGNS